MSDQDTKARVAGWRRLSWWIGLAEILAGAGLSLAGCAYGGELPPVPLFAMLAGFIVPNLFVTMPGALMMKSRRGRWAMQALPLIFLVWLFLNRASFR